MVQVGTLGAIMWKYCLCFILVQVHGKVNNGKVVKKNSGLDLLKDIYYSTNKYQTEKLPLVSGWRFTDEPNSGEITYVNLKKVLNKKRRQLSLQLIGFSQKRTLTNLFGIYLKHKTLPLFEISLDIRRRKVILRYQGETSFQRLTLTFGKELERWTVISATVSRTHFAVTVGCNVKKSIPLRQRLAKIPKRAVGVLASGKYGENKLDGGLFEGRLHPYAIAEKSLLCRQPVNLFENEAGYQNDGPVNGDRILLLEQQITQLNNMVDMLKVQNSNLTTRVAELETCEGCDTACTWDGQIFDEGDTWNPDKCTVCICRKSKPDCLQRTDIASCQVPCMTNPCQNQGQCMYYEDMSPPDDHQCSCQPPYDGQYCEWKENPCVWPQEPGICDQLIPRFYFDMELQECLPFNYTGCGGNINNYETLVECRGVAVEGSCCYRQYSLKVEDVIVSEQKETFGCKFISLSECQSTHRQVLGSTKMEVISFYPGVACDEAVCGRPTEAVCMIDDARYEVGEKAVLGCQECTCERSGQFVCSCSQKAVRKEIRDMTSQELAQFQAAVQQLRLVGPGNPWEEFRDVYMRHTMHSNGGPYFLPWHRLFLRKLEQRLQQIDCSITLPYYDFSTDVGNFEDAIIWQPNYFGGNGVDGCVPDHPFGLPGSWRPCITRDFKTDVKLPTLLELSLALASDDYTEMSMCLEAYVSYVHTYIGGDMASRAAAYDPVFYIIHAYIDMLYWKWQSKGGNKFKYPAAFGNIPMVPFNIPPSAIHDLEMDLCVEYLPPSKGHPCNLTLEIDGNDDKDRGDITPVTEGVFEGGFNSLGYNKKGYDRRGFNETGYKTNGFNRDNYNVEGYDIDGYNRYGYSKDGYSRYGYDIEGWSRENIQDLSGRYNAYGVDMNCLDRRGLDKNGYDKYGFNYQGYDRNNCNYFFTGPFATIQSQKIWEILLVQSKAFIMSLSRTCPGLEPLPSNWLQQYWITDIKDVTEMIPVANSNSQMHNSARFCFDIDDFITPCGCDVGIATCTENVCQTMACPSYPEASCRVDFCGTCKPRWFFNGKEVDCFEERDFCQPNPCDNGGTCVASIWPTEPQLTTCLCPPGYDGHYCQYESLDTCELPYSPGQQGGSGRSRRWYFDTVTQTCVSGSYNGRGGNANNFPSKGACDARCKIGACCYRYPKTIGAVIGYDIQGYDVYGFNIDNKNRRGDVRVESNGIKTGSDRFKTSRYDLQGFDRNGYDNEGYDRWGLDKSGFDREGFNMTGYSQAGEYDGIIDYDPYGYDAEGFNRAGYNCYGNKRHGHNAYEVYAEYTYKCRSASLQQCQRIESQSANQVVKFTRGRRCEEVECGENCGCLYNDKTYKFGESFKAGCQFCKCTFTGSVDCTCPKIYRRKEVRDLTREEMQKYQDAVKSLNKMEFPSSWFKFAQMFADYKPQALGNSGSLPWHRHFLRLVERELQEVDCEITIPYYDWTVNAGNQIKSRIWAANMFGGNGEGISGCVRHHPFKDYYPPYWVPCLRRSFNSSVQLPDVVDIQNAMNEPTYDRFRLSMEVYFDMFKTWVGGDMDSDYSPYDPIFLSVAAFIDRLWWDWEKKTENGLLLYPQEKRYIPMMPFRTTPDDVMDSKKQLCITYFPLSEGAVCNITLPNLNFNSLGYDRHGYNKEGYDIEGYNVYGVDRDGKIDNRGIYNFDGYDREGFKRNGYDDMGLDRFGFSIDNYNIDGYDSMGYDRSGYDRYGFDKTGITPFGFHRNGTLLVDKTPDIFDAYGYNRFGLNRYGFDRQGYDVFGFDSLGYDRRHCNRGYLGPMLVIIKRWAELELDRVDDKTIRVITRICPAVSSLPEWRYTLNWLKRGDQVPLIEGIVGRAQERAQAQIPPLRTTSVTGENVWLPLGPDKSLCFVTYYYTECPFGKLPVDCPVDLCSGRRCPGYPDALCRVSRCGSCEYEWYNGVNGNTLECSGCLDRAGGERAEGTSWSWSECETCTCTDGLVSCEEEICPIVPCTHPVKIPGKCCSSCIVGCDYGGILYEDGLQFSSITDQCDICTCNRGSVTCDPRPCPDLDPCVSMVTLDGECCPTCMDCGNRGSGEVWMETPCQQCTCLSGRVECERIQCIPPDCSHPQVPQGQCCPACQGCTINGRDLPEGGTYMRDQCTECVCRQGNVICEPTLCPVAACVNPITPRGECCPTCDNECLYDRRKYRHEESFISREDQCTNCTCRNTIITCQAVTCPRMNLPCRRPLTLPGECCPSTCPTCQAEGSVYENGASWKSVNDACETCHCEEGIVACQRQDICPLECQHGVIRQGQCCSQCTDCIFGGQFVGDGQIFVRPGDNCQQCTCDRGDVTCLSLGPCPRLQCRVTETPPGACCPQCKRCDYNGATFTHGEVVTQDQCSTCYCREGEVSCDQVECPDLQCRYPRDVPGQCCPVCDECDYKGLTYDEGDRFTPRREPCLDCECRAGEVACGSRESDCPLTRCTHPIRSTKQCCPTCDGCSYLRRRIRNGQKFVPPGQDNCQVCKCTAGSIECNHMDCPAVYCDNAVLVKGQCCPVCPLGCNVMGIEYRDGQTFIDFMNRCQVCTCMMGQIRCMRMMTCPRVSCTHPANMAGNCCPSCTMCEQNNIQYRNGETFTDPAELCQECTCRDGSITCRDKGRNCPTPFCTNPTINPATCCAECTTLVQACMYAGRQYTEGQEVPASRDSCETCRCIGGMVDCSRRQCPVVNCRHPWRDQCCDTCEYCDYDGMRFELGATWPSREDPCEDCVCQAGSVSCERKYCDIPNCSAPVYLPGVCCPSCSDCTFQGLLYKDGENFENPSNPCETCHCMSGNVACDTRMCPKVSCDNPITTGCCPQCTSDCVYEGATYRNGEPIRGDDKCTECRCVGGVVRCTTVSCPAVTCEHPVMSDKDCCPTCNDCSYQNRFFRNGQAFTDTSDDCNNQCTCNYGTVSCDPLLCPPVTCVNPVRGKCCLECLECNYLGRIVQDGETIPSSFGDPCEECRCNQGNMQCFTKECQPTRCSHPIRNDCCDVCDACTYNGQNYQNGLTFIDPQDQCQQCLCSNGNVDCFPVDCPPVNCRDPIQDGCCAVCSRSTNCVHGNRTYMNGDTFRDNADPCTECVCRDGNVECSRRQCPPRSCSHPIRSQCCYECSDCTYDNINYRNGQQFLDNCRSCSCTDGNVVCLPYECPAVQCVNPVTRDCCPVCTETTTGSCTWNRREFRNGELVPGYSEPCTTCTCKSGNIVCERPACPRLTCSHPTQGSCCPECHHCQIGARKIQHGDAFTDITNPCSTCVCQSGTITCNRRRCQPVKCLHPTQDKCGCPVCGELCRYDNTEVRNGQVFTDQTDKCKECTCRSGSVSCIKKRCPRLTCLQQETSPGQCCPVCKGCTHDGIEHEDGADWMLPKEPCVTCTCSGGFVTCMERQCFTPCTNSVLPPGQCCPVCPSCRYNGIEYRDGDSFSPSSDPCDVCQCKDGGLHCYHDTCPGLSDCPRDQQRAPPPGTCCPTCSGLSTDCTRARFGEVTYPRPDDPCFYCECQSNFDWLCSREECASLPCDSSVYQSKPGQCCPACPACYDSQNQRHYTEGDTWTRDDNPCVSCRCLTGTVQCDVIDCVPSNCRQGERLVTSPGQCCPVCLTVQNQGCTWQGVAYQHTETWQPDACTSCLCRDGTVSCTGQACRDFQCGPTDQLTILPGSCCPVCLPKPGTCVVYGDPHYRTFDGSTIHFQGTCRYIMASDCDNEDFIIEVQHDDRGIPGVSWAQNFTITVGRVTVDLLQDHHVLVNGIPVSLPYNEGTDISVERRDDHILVITKQGVKLLWNGDSYGELSVPGNYTRRMCGLCGNFNGFPQDDMRTRTGQITQSPAVFGHSWKASQQTSCGVAMDTDPCVQAGYRVRKQAAATCEVIRGASFSACHGAVPFGPYYSSCVYDLCACTNTTACLCDILASYARECARAGVRLEWRSRTLCAIQCDTAAGFLFDECGPVCHRSCDNWRTPLGDISQNCYKPCVAGCQCPADKVVHNGRCIPTQQCPGSSSVVELPP